MNPTKGKGQRYIYCPHDGGACLDMVIKHGWSTFNCEKCAIYMNSESAQGAGPKAQGNMDSRFHGNDEDEHVRPAVIATEGKEGEEMAKCLVYECEKEGKHRGLCSAHIQRYRKGTLPGVEPLPSNRGKSPKKDRIELLKESAERVKDRAKGGNLKPEREEKKSEEVTLISDPVSVELVSTLDVQIAENTDFYKKCAVAFINMIEKKVLIEIVDGLFNAGAVKE